MADAKQAPFPSPLRPSQSGNFLFPVESAEILQKQSPTGTAASDIVRQIILSKDPENLSQEELQFIETSPRATIVQQSPRVPVVHFAPLTPEDSRASTPDDPSILAMEKDEEKPALNVADSKKA